MSFVYLEEDLPEIEIRELVANEEIYEYEQTQKKGINVYKPEEILLQLTLLLQSKQRAKVFQSLHQEITKDDVFVFPGTILPEVSIQRKDNGDEEQFFNEYDEAKKIDNYYTRRQQLNRAFLGYETTDESAPQLELNTVTRVISDNEKLTLLPEDKLPATVKNLHQTEGFTSFDDSFLKLNLTDKIIETQQNIFEEHPINPTDTIEKQLQTLLENKIPAIIDNLPELTDLYGLWKEFMRHNTYITIDHLELLNAKLDKLKKKDKEVYTFLKATKSYKPSQASIQEDTGAYLFYMIQLDIFKKLAPIFEVLQSQLLTLYQKFLDANPVQNIDSLPNTAYEIADLLIQDKLKLSEVISMLKLRLLKDQLTNIQEWFTIIKEWEINMIETKVLREVERFQNTQFSKYDEDIIPWNSVNEHIKEIKKGEVIDKDPNENAYLPTIHEKDDLIIESDDPNDLTLPIYEEDEFPLDISSLDEGRQEVFRIVLRMFMTLQKATGLPLDIQKLLLAIPMQLRKTKLVQIKEQLPELSEELQIILSKTDLTQIEDVIESVKIKNTLRLLLNNFIKDIEFQYSYLLAWWICQLQSHVLNRTLNFEIWKGSLNSIPVWSPYGAPMEGLKSKKESMIAYILSVIYDLKMLEGTSWNKYCNLNSEELENKLFHYFENEFNETVLELQATFKTFDKDLPLKHLQAKGEAIKEDISKTVEKRNKSRYLIEYMRFLKNLPSVLIQSSIAKRIYSGCCLQLLSEKYRSDYDWSAYVKDAYKLKKLFATQRIGIEKRPKLAVYEPVNREERPSLFDKSIIDNKDYLIIAEKEEWIIDNWIPELETYMPFNDYTLLKQGIQNIIPVIEKNVNTYTRMLKDTLFNPFILKNANLQTLLEFYRKILQVQNFIIHTEYSNKEKEFNYLDKEFKLYLKLYELLLTTTDYYSDVQELYRKRMIQYFIVRQLCFPAKPEFSRTNTLVLIEDYLESDLLSNFLKTTYDELKLWVEQKEIQTTTNFLEYIAKMREQENIAKLKIIDRMNPEERKLYVEAKKIGIEELYDYLEKFEEIEEDYIAYGENNEETDMDKLYDDEV